MFVQYEKTWSEKQSVYAMTLRITGGFHSGDQNIQCYCIKKLAFLYNF